MLRPQPTTDSAHRLPLPPLALPQRVLLVIALSAGAATVGAAQRMPERSAAPVASCATFVADARESADPETDTSSVRTGDAIVSPRTQAGCDDQEEQESGRGRIVPRRLRSGAFAAALAVGVGSNAVFGFDRTRRDQPDVFIAGNAAAHVALMASLTQAGIAAGVAPWKSAALVTAAGVGFELSQGMVSKQDLGANAVGVLAAWGWWKLWQPNRRQSR